MHIKTSIKRDIGAYSILQLFIFISLGSKIVSHDTSPRIADYFYCIGNTRERMVLRLSSLVNFGSIVSFYGYSSPREDKINGRGLIAAGCRYSTAFELTMCFIHDRRLNVCRPELIQSPISDKAAA
jgi:hypothetical protein